MLRSAWGRLLPAGMLLLVLTHNITAQVKSAGPRVAGVAAGKKHTIYLEGKRMAQTAGAATFELPPNWIDESTYQYQSPEHLWKVTLMFDTSVKEESAQAVISDRVEESKLVLPGFRLEERSPIGLGGRTGETATFVSQDADQVTRTRIVVVMLAPATALIVMAQGPASRWREFEPLWQHLISSFRLAW